MRFWLLEHLGERACAACGEVPASGGAPRISHAVTVAGVPIETEMEPAFAIAWGQIFRQGCACGGQREYVYPRDLRSYSAERDALAGTEPITLVADALAPGDHGETVLVRLYHLGQGTEYIRYWNPQDAVCALCGDAATIIFSPSGAEALRLARKNEKPNEFLACALCDALVAARDFAGAAERLELPRREKTLPRFASMSALEQARALVTHMRTLEREPIAWIAHDLRVNDITLLQPGSLSVSGEVNGIDVDAHRWILEHPRVYITAYQLFRSAFRARYSYSIPSRAALEALERHAGGGVVECGAGNGYWSYLLRARGSAEVDAFDITPLGAGPNTWYDGASRPWTEVRRGDVDVLRKHKAKLLLLCWPPPKSSMALYALQLFKGDSIAYIGTHDDSCATPAFFEMLGAQWEEVERVAIPTIWRLNDDLRIYRRR